jgi:hypothetical protein
MPSKYTVWDGESISPFQSRTLDATSGLARLPAEARALLRGKERTYTNYGLLDDEPVPRLDPGPGTATK